MLSSIFSTCIPRHEILGGNISQEIFAAKLKQVVDGTAPLVYSDATNFFANTYPTNGLKTLIAEVFGRLTGAATGSPVNRLETSFGGGKTHDEIALWHIAKNGRSIQGLDRFVDNIELIPDCPVQVAAIACQDLDPVNGVLHEETGIKVFTLWGEIAYQIGGVEGYSLLKGSDQQRVSPGTVVLEKLTKDQPTIIILDEIGDYLRKAKAVIVGNSDLSKQVISFLFALMDLAGSSSKLVFVYTLASSSDAYKDETEEIREAVRISARQERVHSPSTDVEIYNIVKQRIFSSIDVKAAENAAKEYLQTYKTSRLNLPEGCKDASHAQLIESSYPFLPELFDLLTKKIASIPNFQRTRGALRLFAMIARNLWQDTSVWIPMIHPHHIPVGVDDDVTTDLTSRLERPLMLIPIQADIYNKDGKEAHAQVYDREWLVAGKPPFTTWVTRTIFLHSINQGTAAGVRKVELNLSLLTPGIESGFVDTVLERIAKVAWYLDVDPITSIARFKEEPSINKIIAEEKEQVGRVEAKDDLRSRRDSIFASKIFTLISDPQSSGEVDDKPEDIALCMIDFDEATVSDSKDPAPILIEQIFNNSGESGKFRTFRNRLLFLVANKQELDRAIDNAREYRAIQNILKSPNRLEDLSESQQKQLKAKGGEMDLAVRVALTNAYRHLFYPTNDPVKAPKGLLHYTLPAHDSSDVKGNKNQQDVILKALKDCQKIRSEEAAPFAPAYILQKVWSAGIKNWTTKALKEAFAKDLSLNIFLDAEVSKLRETIRKGLQDGQWDMKVGNKIYIRDDTGKLATLPETIEFSERMELYRRGILKLPEPRVIELNAQVLPSSEISKPVRIKWRAQGALSISLYQDGKLIAAEFRPSDEHETMITETTIFKLLADYGSGEILEKEAQAIITKYPTGMPPSPNGSDQQVIFTIKPEVIEETGSPNAAFTGLSDRCADSKVRGINSLELSVDQVMDYRKLATALPLFPKLNIQIDQIITVQSGDQFVRLVYQGTVQGFQGFLTPTNTLLGGDDVKADVMLKLVFKFEPAVSPESSELNTIIKALARNPVEKLGLTARVVY